MSVGESIPLELDLTYSDGSTAPAYIPASAPANFQSSDTTKLTVNSAGEMQAVAPGQVTVTASYGGYSAQDTVTIGAAGLGPQISSPSTANGTVGTAFNYQITATNSPTGFNATNLPSGLSVDSSGLISGTPTMPGTYSVTTTASNATLYSDTNTLTLTIADPFSGSSLGSGWYYSSWFGTYNTSYYPWIYRTDLGFIYVTASNGDTYLYVDNGSSPMGWLYTNATVYPNVYSFTKGSWLYFSSGSTSFYNYTTQAWETY